MAYEINTAIAGIRRIRIVATSLKGKGGGRLVRKVFQELVSQNRVACSIQIGVATTIKRAILRTDSKLTTVTAKRRKVFRRDSFLLKRSKPQRVKKKKAKGNRDSPIWKLGDCHSWIKACWAVEKRVWKG